MPVVYSLTPLTGRTKNENRRVVILTVETRRRTLIVALLSLFAGMIPAGIAALLVGAYAIVVPLLFMALGLWLYDSRSRKGLRLHNYQAIVDARRAQNGVLFAAGRPITTPQLVMHQHQTVPARRTASVDVAPVRSEPNLSALRGKPSTLRRRTTLEARTNP